VDRVCVIKSSGEILEIQSGGDDNPDLMEMRLDTLTQNALNAGYKAEEIEVKWVNSAELTAIIAASKPVSPGPTKEEIEARTIEALIIAKARELAIAALIADGKLTGDGKLAAAIKV
jgi:hypothetical protein